MTWEELMPHVDKVMALVMCIIGMIYYFIGRHDKAAYWIAFAVLMRVNHL